MRRYLLMATCLILALSLTSCESLKSIAASAIPSSPKPKVEMYAIPPEGFFGGSWRFADLKTIGYWEGTGREEISISIGSNPAVVNASARPTSKVASNFGISVHRPSQMIRGMEEELSGSSRGGIYCVLIKSEGNYKISIDASGVNWWVKLGTE